MASASLLQWADDAVAALTRWHQRTAPGGSALVSCFVEPTLADLRARLPEATPLPWRTDYEWFAAAQRAGWRVVRADTRDWSRRYANALEALRWLHRSGLTRPAPTLSGATLRKRLQAWNAAAPSNGITLSWRALRLELRRDEA